MQTLSFSLPASPNQLTCTHLASLHGKYFRGTYLMTPKTKCMVSFRLMMLNFESPTTQTFVPTLTLLMKGFDLFFRQPNVLGHFNYLTLLLQRCWQHDPEKRPTAEEACEELKAFLPRVLSMAKVTPEVTSAEPASLNVHARMLVCIPRCVPLCFKSDANESRRDCLQLH